MGFAVDNYAIFDCIASGGLRVRDRSSRLARAVAAAFDTFTIVAFVVHDPTLHADFDQYLGQVFETIDQKTGSDLLVFALTRPSREWVHYARTRRPYHGRLDEALSAVRGSSRVGPLAVHALAARLGIPASDLPVIVLTQNLGDSGFTWVRTQPDEPGSGDGICQQLERLGELANDLAVGRRSHDLGAIRASIDVSGFGQVRLGTSLAEAVCEALAPASGRHDVRRVTALLDTVRAKLRSIADAHRGELPPDVEQQLADLEVTLAYALRAAEGQASKRFAPPAGLEPLSQELLTLASDVLDLILSRRDDTADLSPVVMCVGKALETELNLSVVQWARALAGVEMPDFFGKGLPRSRQRPVIEVEGGYRLDLSGRGRNPDANVGNLPAVIGQCVALLRWARPRAGQAPPAVSDATEDMEEWIDELRRRRNQAAHPDRVGELDGRYALERATDRAAIRRWEELVSMKHALRGKSWGGR